MTMVNIGFSTFWASIVVLGIALLSQIFWRSRVINIVKWLFAISVCAMFSVALFYSFLQYKVWSADKISMHFLPPYQSADYFLSYVFTRYLAKWVLAFLAALIFFFAAKWMNRRFNERFFEREEPWFLALGIFLSGYPGFLFYIPAILLCGVVITLIYALLRRGRAPLYYFWLPASIFVILLVYLWMPQSFLTQFNL